MKLIKNSKQIFTPQGRLEDIEKNPNLDFLMNVFNISRAFGVSGFGNSWNVGQHSFAVALIAFFWAKFNRFDGAKRDRLVTLAILHDTHEAVTGDVLPMLKSDEVRQVLDRIQENIMKALGVEDDKSLKVDMKIADMIAFLYEIKQVSPNILQQKKLSLAHAIFEQQRENLFKYAKQNDIPKEKIMKFLKKLEF